VNAFEPDRVERFEAADGSALVLHLFIPDRTPTAALLLFHGGGWVSGAPFMFHPQARALAETGILTASASYRLVGSTAATPLDCMADAERADTAFRGLARDASAPALFVGGGSAGAQLALGLAMPPPDVEWTAKPYAGMVLFNPVLDVHGGSDGQLRALARDVLGVNDDQALAISPIHHVRAGMPAAVVFHGTADELVPIETARRFRDRTTGFGNRCELVEFSGEGHGFFNHRPEGNPAFDRTLELTEKFLHAQMAEPAAVLGF